MSRRRAHTAATIAVAAVLGLVTVAPSSAAPTVGTETSTEPTAPVGFAVTPYAELGGAATSIAFGPDTRDLDATRLYVADWLNGRVVAYDHLGASAGPPTVFADGFRNPLGVVVADDGTAFVADSEATRPGPFGERPYGRVWRVLDADGDGVADQRELVLRDLPNGRHNTNNLAIGADGLLYVTNGNATDDGIEGGAPEALPWSGSVVRIDPHATDVSVADLDPDRALVATGLRNVYDVAFSSADPTQLFLTMNGVDDAREDDSPPPEEHVHSDDLLYVTDVADARPPGRDQPEARSGDGDKDGFASVIDDFGFPSCLYDVERMGGLDPFDNPHPEVIERFGHCPTETVPRPVASFGAHPSADGLAFQTTGAWGPSYSGDLFVAEFGNFFGEGIVGHRVVHVQLDGTGVSGQEPFLTGVTPLDVAFDTAGALYVADFTGTILRVDRIAG